jgi:hypothetical protein
VVLIPVAPLAGLGDAGAVGGAGGVAVWTLTPANVEVSAEEREKIAGGMFYNQF